METEQFEFRLPQSLIRTALSADATEPRDHARLVVVHRRDRRVEHRRFDDIVEYLDAGDVLVLNDSLVMQDQLVGQSRRGRMRLILCGLHRDGWHVLVKPSTRAGRGVVVKIGEGAIRVTLRKQNLGTDMWLADLECDGDLADLLSRYGTRIGLDDAPEDARHRYQNVYARTPGSVEVPSAGLHFTPELLARIEARGVTIVPITLHVGLTEMSPFRVIDTPQVEDHQVASEWYRVSAGAAQVINRARRHGGRVVAVGTTVVRTLETVADTTSRRARVTAGEGWTDLHLHPARPFDIVDVMLTNLHQPRSSHLVLVAAFAGVELTTSIYRQLVGDRYRFDVFGDSMLVT
jgi:S-adenosylmethionine:tRNA-ribosyltransferase-isomerase (queuine synthetase)